MLSTSRPHGSSYQIRSFLSPRLTPHPASRRMARHNNLVADDRIRDVEAVCALALLVLQYQRERIGTAQTQGRCVETGHFEIQRPLSASADWRTQRHQTGRDCLRSKVLEESSIALMVDGLDDKRIERQGQSRGGHTGTCAARQREPDARIQRIFLDIAVRG